jgi:hypothetical protein
MESNQGSPGRQRKLGLLETLQRIALQYGRTTTTEECLAVCRQFVQDGVLEKKAIRYAVQGSIGWQLLVQRKFREHLQAHTQAVGRQKISLPLGLHTATEIHLTEEQALQAMPLEQSGVEYSQLLKEFEEPVVIQPTAYQTKLYTYVPWTPESVAPPTTSDLEAPKSLSPQAAKEAVQCQKKAYFEYVAQVTKKKKIRSSVRLL